MTVLIEVAWLTRTIENRATVVEGNVRFYHADL